jgi:hypothetical protein
MDPGLTPEVFLSGKCPKMQSVSALDARMFPKPRPYSRGMLLTYRRAGEEGEGGRLKREGGEGATIRFMIKFDIEGIMTSDNRGEIYAW